MRKFKNTLSVILVIVMVFGTTIPFVSAADTAIDIYVDAVSGSDSNPGTSDAPIQTLVKAKEVLGTEKGTVHIADGEYFLSSALCWTGGSGEQLWKAEGDNVVITGGRKISSGWNEDTLNGVPCISMSVENAPKQVMLFGKDGLLANSRMPDEGYFYLKDGVDPSSDNGTFAHNRAVVTKTEDTAALGTSGQTFGAEARAFIRVYHYWMEEPLVIESYSKTDGKIVFCTDFETPFTICTSRSGDPYCLENVIAGFSKPGEWYMDYSSNKLYYIPRSGETKDNTEVWLATTEQLININGADNVSFEGIKFRNTNAVYTTNYSQSAYGSKATALVNNAENINFRNCEFSSIGETALCFGNWGSGNVKNVLNCSVTGCLFNQIGASAVAVAGQNNENLCPKNIIVNDNVIMNYGKNRGQACGIFVTFGNNISVTHNEVHDGMYTGISCGWLWGYNKTCNYDNDISYNLIYNIGHGPMSDMGGIYVLGIQTGSTMNNNVVFNVCAGEDATTYGGWGLYTDEGSQGWTIENNIAFDNGSQGFHQHYGYRNMIRNNIFAFNNEGQARSSAQWVSIEVAGVEDASGENKAYAAQTTPGDQFFLYNDILVGNNQPMYHAYSDNYFIDDKCIYWDMTLGENVISAGKRTKKKEIQKSGNTNNYGNGVFKDPKFVDYENGNFNFVDDSVISLIGFRDIDVSTVGSSTFASFCLINDLAHPKPFYDSTMWNAWEEAKAGAVAVRNEKTIKTLKETYGALTRIDEYADFVIGADRYCSGAEYEAFASVYERFAEEIKAGNPASETTEADLRNAFNVLCSKEYVITLDANGAVSDGIISYRYADGDKIVLPEPESRNATLFFAGWKRSTDGEIVEAGSYTAGAGDYTLTAQWEKSTDIFKIILNAIKIFFSRIAEIFR